MAALVGSWAVSVCVPHLTVLDVLSWPAWTQRPCWGLGALGVAVWRASCFTHTQRASSPGPVLLSPLFRGPGAMAVSEMCSVCSDRCREAAKPVAIPGSPHRLCSGVCAGLWVSRATWPEPGTGDLGNCGEIGERSLETGGCGGYGSEDAGLWRPWLWPGGWEAPLPGVCLWECR